MQVGSKLDKKKTDEEWGCSDEENPAAERVVCHSNLGCHRSRLMSNLLPEHLPLLPIPLYSWQIRTIKPRLLRFQIFKYSMKMWLVILLFFRCIEKTLTYLQFISLHKTTEASENIKDFQAKEFIWRPEKGLTQSNDEG